MAISSRLSLALICALAGAALPAASTPSAAADEVVSRGGALARKLCAGCHAVGLTGPSKLEKAPPMRDLARRWKAEQIAEALAEGITTGHKEMPEFKLNPDELDAFLSWFDDLGVRAKAPAAKP